MSLTFQFEADPHNPRLDAAQRYAREGWPVFPCWGVDADGICACRDPACNAVGKHPVSVGSTGASCDRACIGAWWFGRPRANVAIRTGGDLVVIDLDLKPDRDGLQSWAALEARHGDAPRTVTSVTGSGGRHLFFRVPEVVRNYQAGDRLGPGIDVRGHNGFVIAPPSRHRSGGHYRWAEGLGPDDVPVADCPAWLFDLLTRADDEPTSGAWREASPHAPRVRPPANFSAPPRLPEVIAAGTRNMVLFSLAGTLGQKGLDYEEIRAVIDAVNAGRCAPPVPAAEVSQIAESASRYVTFAGEPGALTRVSRGARRFTDLLALASALVRRGLSAAETAHAMAVVNDARCDPDLTPHELSLLLTDVLIRTEFAR